MTLPQAGPQLAAQNYLFFDCWQGLNLIGELAHTVPDRQNLCQHIYDIDTLYSPNAGTQRCVSKRYASDEMCYQLAWTLMTGRVLRTQTDLQRSVYCQS